jgi:hypothetical protein
MRRSRVRIPFWAPEKSCSEPMSFDRRLASPGAIQDPSEISLWVAWGGIAAGATAGGLGADAVERPGLACRSRLPIPSHIHPERSRATAPSGQSVQGVSRMGTTGEASAAVMDRAARSYEALTPRDRRRLVIGATHSRRRGARVHGSRLCAAVRDDVLRDGAHGRVELHGGVDAHGCPVLLGHDHRHGRIRRHRSQE